ncbi:MAG: M48 metallopeptidase family protein [Thermodesulfobacteriota bacterium]
MELSNISYKVSYRNVKYPRLEFKTGELLFVLPFGHKPRTLLEKHKGWIFRKIEFIKDCLNSSSDKEIVERTDNELKNLVYSFVEKHPKKLGVELNRIYFRKMITKWASCSSKRNLTINRLMKHLPKHLVEYVIFHEIAHIIEKRHNDKFWGIISKRFNNYQELERDLFVYWFRVVKNDA